MRRGGRDRRAGGGDERDHRRPRREGHPDARHGADRVALDAQGSLGDIAMHASEYHRPSNAKDAVALVLKKEEGRYLAGGQSLVQATKLRLSSRTDLIDLNASGARRARKAESNAA